MFRGILFRSIFAELAKIFVLALIGLTGIIVLAGIVVEATQRGLGPAQILAAIPLLVPSLLPFIVPPTTLFTACVVYGRLSHDNEIIAIKSAGINILRVVWPGVLLGLVMSLTMVGLYYHLIPYTQHLLRSMATRDLEEFLYALLKTDHEISNRPGFKLNYEMWVAGVEGRQSRNAVFKRRATNGKFDVVATAREAELHVRMDRGEHGEVEVRMRNGRVLGERSDAWFEEQTWFVPLNPIGDVKLSPRDMTWQELLEARQQVIGDIDTAKRDLAVFALELAAKNLNFPPAQLDEMNRHYHNTVRVKEQRLAGLNTELCMRPALACGCVFFVLVGCPVGIWFSKSDYLSAFITCFLPIVLIYYPVQLCSTNLAKDGRVAPILALWAANALMAVMALPLFHRLLKN